jgi:hypothetical protein
MEPKLHSEASHTLLQFFDHIIAKSIFVLIPLLLTTRLLYNQDDEQISFYCAAGPLRGRFGRAFRGARRSGSRPEEEKQEEEDKVR